MNPIVSIIVPCYNQAQFLDEALQSVLKQSFSNWECIIINDGSPDNTDEVVKKWIDIDSRFIYLSKEKGGVESERNVGIAKARGVYIACLDADDLWIPEKLEIQLQEIKEKNVDLVFSDSYIFNDDNVCDRSTKMNTLNQIFKGNEALSSFLERNRIPTLTVLAKKDKIHSVNGFIEKKEIPIAEDYHLWLKMLIDNSVFYGSDKILASYRIHSTSSTSQDKLASRQIPEVFFDLTQNNPGVKQLILKALKKELQKQYNTKSFSKSNFYFIIDENCRYLNKQIYAPFYKVINYFLGVKLTKKFLNHILNA